ncbi:Uncharacterised protein [BD1-7 clade bacterium]|uniref:DUF2970 domain-containing protein n=1 Tax=BD1-7 clade bacterium TaxID=2029982 RepID=A0A5S9QC21_9GAMM|nr:Uncharacterised protein [BD1-7 clade bacterium]
MSYLSESASEPTCNGDKPLSTFELIGSAFAGLVGVQSRKNRIRDFSRGRPLQFVAVGVIFTGLFFVSVMGVVQLALASAS